LYFARRASPRGGIQQAIRITRSDSSLLNPASQACQKVKTIQIHRKCKVDTVTISFKSIFRLTDAILEDCRISASFVEATDEDHLITPSYTADEKLSRTSECQINLLTPSMKMTPSLISGEKKYSGLNLSHLIAKNSMCCKD
jgi:hypothetical protein